MMKKREVKNDRLYNYDLHNGFAHVEGKSLHVSVTVNFSMQRIILHNIL